MTVTVTHLLQSLQHLQVVYGHLDDPQGQDIQRGVSYLKLRPGDAGFWLHCIDSEHVELLKRRGWSRYLC